MTYEFGAVEALAERDSCLPVLDVAILVTDPVLLLSSYEARRSMISRASFIHCTLTFQSKPELRKWKTLTCSVLKHREYFIDLSLYRCMDRGFSRCAPLIFWQSCWQKVLVKKTNRQLSQNHGPLSWGQGQWNLDGRRNITHCLLYLTQLKLLHKLAAIPPLLGIKA